jgi:hypothetical protein
MKIRGYIPGFGLYQDLIYPIDPVLDCHHNSYHCFNCGRRTEPPLLPAPYFCEHCDDMNYRMIRWHHEPTCWPTVEAMFVTSGIQDGGYYEI